MSRFGKAREAARKTSGESKALALVADAPAQPAPFAQGRAHPNLTLDDLPQPVKVSEVEGVPLSTDEAELFGLCQRAVDELEAATLVAAKALANIRDRKLYRETHGTFEEFVHARWNRSRAWAYQQIDAFQVTEVLFPGAAELLPRRHTRELAATLRADGETAMVDQYDAAKDSEGRVTLERLQERRPPSPRQAPAPRQASSPQQPSPRRPPMSTGVDTGELEFVDAELVDDSHTDPVGAALAPLREINVELAELLRRLDEAVERALTTGPDAIPVLNSVSRQAAAIAAKAGKR